MESNKMVIFSSEEFGSVEVINFKDADLFRAKDIGKCLGINGSTLSEHLKNLDEDEVIILRNSDFGNTEHRKLNNAGEKFITESGIYYLVGKSRKPEAKKFSRWVRKEVLPNIRKNGMYIKEEKLAEMMSQPENLIKILENYNREKIRNKELQREIDEVKPKAKRLDNIASSFSFKDMNSTAKALGVGRNTLMELLRRKKVLISKLSNKNQPYEKYIQNGYFTVKIREFFDKDGEIKLFYQPMVTNKGLVWLENKVNNEWNDEIENKKLKMVNEN